MAGMLTEADVQRLMSSPSGDVRAETAEKIAVAFDAGKLTDRERELAEEIFRVMMRDVEVMVREALAGLVGYGVGCVAIGYLLVRAKRGTDVRAVGSGRVGATNVGRVLGRWGFAWTLLGDMAKAVVAVRLGLWLGDGPRGAWLALLAVVCGHIWPVPLRFRGGRGVAPR